MNADMKRRFCVWQQKVSRKNRNTHIFPHFSFDVVFSLILCLLENIRHRNKQIVEHKMESIGKHTKLFL